MAAPKGNTYYLLAKGFGGSDKDYTPEQLWQKAIEYFKWNDENPLKEQKVFGSGYSTNVDKMRAMSLRAFCNYAAISKTTFDNYELNEAHLVITTRIREIIYQQKFEGAAADLLNQNIISRELGLTEKTESKVTGSMNVNYINQPGNAPLPDDDN